ncbi:MAG TPA: hypothetical protein VIT23_08585 [Terrimicrobiaceae bacterium]
MEMNPFSEEWIELWRLKAIASSLSAELQLRYGLKEFYPPEEVESACCARNAEGSSMAIVLAMFVDPHESQGILKAYGISDPVEELRRIMASKLFYADIGVSAESETAPFCFHDAGYGHSSWSFEGGSGGDGGFDGGGAGGEQMPNKALQLTCFSTVQTPHTRSARQAFLQSGPIEELRP